MIGSVDYVWVCALLTKHTRPFALSFAEDDKFQGSSWTESWSALSQFTSGLVYCNRYLALTCHAQGMDMTDKQSMFPVETVSIVLSLMA